MSKDCDRIDGINAYLWENGFEKVNADSTKPIDINWCC